MLEVFDLLERTKLNWTVNKENLISLDGLKTDSFGLFRNDNDKWLGTVGKRYCIYQNAALAEVIVKASEDIVDPELITGGMLRGGKKVFLQIPLDDEHIGNDKVKRYITALNSHDGSTSIGFGSTNTVVICSNTYYQAHKQLNKFRHTSSANEAILTAQKQLRGAILKDNSLMEDFKRMTEHKIDLTLFGDIVAKLFKVELNTSSKEVSTRTKNNINTFKSVMDKELASHGETLWGLFNGVTYFTNHSETAGKSESEKKDHLLFGGGYSKNLMTYNEIMKFIKSKTKSIVSV